MRNIRLRLTALLAAGGLALAFFSCRTSPPDAAGVARRKPAGSRQKPVKIDPQVGLTREDWPQTPQRQATFMPFGVYWAGEYLWQTDDKELDWDRIDASLEDLAAHHCNAVWLTHRSAAETAEFARRAARHGIYVVASIAHLAGEVPHIRKGNHEKLIKDTFAGWGDAPPPIAWGLGDEPRTSYMGEMKTYVDAWKQHAPGEPVTTVVMWRDTDAAGKAGFDVLACDIYPFFSPGNPNGYGRTPRDIWRTSGVNLVRQPGPGWIMGQAYQEPWGPWELDQQGNIVYLPGGAPHWVMPSPSGMRWQAWATMAVGGKGVFYFLYRWPVGQGNPKAKPCKLPAARRERWNSGAPRGLIHADGRSTPQYEAMADAFAEIRALRSVLAPLEPASNREVWLKNPKTNVLLGLHRHPQTGERVLVAVGPPHGEKPLEATLVFTPNIVGLREADGGRRISLTATGLWRETTFSLRPGEGRVFHCETKGADPVFYADNFNKPRFKQDAVKTSRVKIHNIGSSRVLGALDGAANFNNAFVVYDLDKLLGPRPDNTIRVLLYQSFTTTNYRGADWTQSTDGKTYKPLSRNQPGKPVAITARYLRVGLSWRQAGSVHYGNLSDFQIVQCPKPVDSREIER